MNDRPENQATQPVPDALTRPAAQAGTATIGPGSATGSGTGDSAARPGHPVAGALDPADAPGIGPAAWDGAVVAGGTGAQDDDLDLLDPAWTPSPRINRLTLVLAAGLVAALAFAGGVLVQKQHDAGLISPASAGGAARAFRSGAGGGFGGQGGTAGQGGAGQGLGGNGSRTAGSGAQGLGGGPGAGGSDAAVPGGGGDAGPAAGAPVVVGKVVSVSAGTVVVENFAGTRVTVHVGASTPVTAPGVTGLQAGSTVSVTGTKAADGSVNATAVVSRGSGNG